MVEGCIFASEDPDQYKRWHSFELRTLEVLALNLRYSRFSVLFAHNCGNCLRRFRTPEIRNLHFNYGRDFVFLGFLSYLLVPRGEEDHYFVLYSYVRTFILFCTRTFVLYHTVFFPQVFMIIIWLSMLLGRRQMGP